MADNKEKSTEEKAAEEALDQFLRSLVPLDGLDADAQDKVIAAGKIVEFSAGQFIFKKGDRDEWSFYVVAGEVELLADEQLMKIVDGGTEGARFALSQLQPRQMSAHARTDLKVLRLDRATVETILSDRHAAESGMAVEEIEDEEDGGDWMSLMLQSNLFSKIPAANIQQIFMHMEEVEMEAGDRVIEQGEPGDYYYIMHKGTAEVTRRAKQDGPEIKLADLTDGDSFGEEALVSDATRNASITMTSKGHLLRLTKDDFINLIQKPVLNAMPYAKIQDLLDSGAEWIDARPDSEFSVASIEGSINLPLNMLRLKAPELLDNNKQYVVYCEDGRRSAVATFLLLQRGYTAYFLQGGLKNSPMSSVLKGDAAPVAAETQAEAAAIADADAVTDVDIEADVRAEALKAEVVKANLDLETAMKSKAEAELAKQKIEEEAEAKLEAEKQRLAEESEQLTKEAADKARAEAEAAIKAEREKLAEEAVAASAVLEEAKQIKAELEAAHQSAALDAEVRRKEEDERIELMKREADERMNKEKAKLDAQYASTAEELAKIQKAKEAAHEELAKAQERMAAQAEDAKHNAAEADRLKVELDAAREKAEAAAQQKIEHQETMEMRLRDEVRTKMAEERKKMEAHLSRHAKELEAARSGKEAAEAARAAAAEEAERIIDEYKAEHAKAKAEEEAQLKQQREFLEAEARKVREALDEARRFQEEAEAARKRADAEAESLRKQKLEITSDQGKDDVQKLVQKIEAAEEEASIAAAQVEEAQDVAQKAEQAHTLSEEELAAKKVEEEKLRKQIEAEAAAWKAEQEKMETATLQRELLQNQRDHMARIRARAAEAKKKKEAANSGLIDDIESMLDADDD